MLLVLTALPDRKSAQKLAASLVDKKLAACVSVLDGASSVYRWKGKVESSRESLLLIKTTRAAWKKVEAFVLGRHPYELPELIALPVTAGSKKYLGWIGKNVE